MVKNLACFLGKIIKESQKKESGANINDLLSHPPRENESTKFDIRGSKGLWNQGG